MVRWIFCLLSLVTVVCQATPGWALDANNLAFLSSGFNPSGNDWQLDDDGYVGTYVRLASPGDVTISVQANGQASGGINPHMNIVVADSIASFDVTPGSTNTYQHTFSLPAGLHFVRTEFTNDPEQSSRSLRIVDLNATGGTLDNTADNANALEAADTYIQNFRRGPATVQLVGVAPGTSVDVKLKQHAFHFGTAVGGSSGINTYLGNGSQSNEFKDALVETRINTLVPENAGKWSSNAPFSPNFFDMSEADQMLDYVENNDMRARMHNLIWGSQQPNWVNTLLSNAQSPNPAISGPAKTELRTRISERIAYYVGDGDGDQNDGDRSQRYYDLDVLNEMIHQPAYLNIFGYDGLAEIHAEVANAIAAAGANSRLAANEYNVLQDNYSDFYGNWYRQEIENLNDTVYGQAVNSIGVQSYENNEFGTGGGAHNPSRKMQTLQNLSILGLPITLTEFGVKDPTSAADAATMMEETMRIVFGTPNADGFIMWGIYRGDIYRGAAALYDSNWNLTTAGQRWVDLMTVDGDADPYDDWDTDLTTQVNPDGTIDFTGFYGEYEVTVDGETFNLDLTKGTDQYSLIVDIPPDFNDDNMVDGTDLGIWESAYGVNNSGDADGDGDSDGDDFFIWQQWAGFGVESLQAGAVTVPEPTTLSLFAISVLFTCCWRRQATPLVRSASALRRL
jgi:GH35 family endo-1,4-beta-xylanase